MKPKVLLTDASMNMLGSVMDQLTAVADVVTSEQDAEETLCREIAGARLDRDALGAALAILQGQRPQHVKNPEVFENDCKIRVAYE